jgi:hypothetical protein
MTMTVLCGLGAAGAAFAAQPKVTSVTLMQPPNTRRAEVSYETDGPGIATFNFKTNGAPLASVAWTVTGDISRYIPSAETHAFTWDAGRDIPERVVSNLTVEVTLWATNATAAAGSYLSNTWGLYDMHGNVWEWCLDWYVSGDASLLGDAPADPSLAVGAARVRCGGSWDSGASSCRSVRRGSGSPSGGNSSVGFRVAAAAEVWIAP